MNIDSALVLGNQPSFLQEVRRWTWCRQTFPTLMRDLASGHSTKGQAAIDLQALANAFWPWAALLDENSRRESLDCVDFAHFHVGMLLAHAIKQRPLKFGEPDRNLEIIVMTEWALTLLAAWRQALGAEAPVIQMDEPGSARWASYVENVLEDSLTAVSYLDVFTGREPEWQFPGLIDLRPPFRRALTRLRGAVG
jgi:hypothetical protein